ncbi:MAG: universal stress protein [Deltaproteobacteria bacterium]|nr:universal stress protein [Deltaproteobacteria bacterium]
MFPHIVIATDLSGYSEQMVDCAGQLQGLSCRKVTLVHVEEARFSVGLAEALAEAHKPELEAQGEKLRSLGFEVSTQIREGIAWYEIVEAARSSRADLVVVGSHGYGTLAESLLGGTAARVVEHSPAPVLLLRMALLESQGRRCSLLCSRALEHVLFPTDFSPASEKAAEVMKRLGDRVRRASLLHVNEETEHLPTDALAAAQAKDLGRLEELAKELRAAGCRDVGVEAARGNPKKVILDRANADVVTLVVMGSQGWGVIKDFLMGSVSQTLVRLARVPVLLARG